MNQTRRSISLGFTSEQVQEGLHICYIYDDEAERQRVIANFLESGLLANEKVLCLVEDVSPQEMLDAFNGLDLQDGALNVLDSLSGYCPSGAFDADVTLNLIRDFYHHAVDREGYAGARGTGQMAWSLDEDRVSEEKLLAYEARVNALLAEHPYTACCQYDARRFSGQMIMNVLSTHPVVIIRGQLVKNPYYVEPARFLEGYRAHA